MKNKIENFKQAELPKKETETLKGGQSTMAILG